MLLGRFDFFGTCRTSVGAMVSIDWAKEAALDHEIAHGVAGAVALKEVFFFPSYLPAHSRLAAVHPPPRFNNHTCRSSYSSRSVVGRPLVIQEALRNRKCAISTTLDGHAVACARRTLRPTGDRGRMCRCASIPLKGRCSHHFPIGIAMDSERTILLLARVALLAQQHYRRKGNLPRR